jgi:hypothetical protein
VLANVTIEPQHNKFFKIKMIKTMKLFAALKRKREFERSQLPFLPSLIDFDIIIEIGYAEEQGKPLTRKQLFLMNLGSRATVRRRLAKLIDSGFVTQRTNAEDHRSAFLGLHSGSLKLLGKYGSLLSTISIMA